MVLLSAQKSLIDNEITYDKKNATYIIYWATTITGKSPVDKSVENGYNHRMYSTSTKDFKNFSATKLFYDQGFNVIDATVIPDGNKFIMFLKDETRNPPQKNIRVVTSERLGGFGKPSAPITGNYWAEGPTATKIGNQWIVYFDKYRDKKYGAVMSADLINWTDVSDKIVMPTGIRHGTVFTISKDEFSKLPK